MNDCTTITFNQDATPARDENGWFQHPHIDLVSSPADETEDADTYVDKRKVTAAGFESAYVQMEQDIDEDGELWTSYFDHGDINITAWTPTPPDGEHWQLVGIWDTEEGPVAMFVRPQQDQVLQ